MAGPISVTLPDGSVRSLPQGATAADLAVDIGPRLAKDAVIAVVDGEERDLTAPLIDGAAVEIVTPDSDRGRFTLRHSTAHVLAQAVLDLFPGATFGIGPPIEDGFYYDFELVDDATFKPEDLDRIDARMREIVAERQPFVRDEIAEEKALEVFAEHPYKLEIIRGAAEDPTSVTEAGVVRTYENPPRFIDLCRGPHVPHTGRLGHFRLMRVAGAYWRGDEGNPMLQRIYGTAWESRAALAAHLTRLEEAEKRDHRRLGAELDLFHFPPEIGGGLAVFHPKGGIVRKLMEDFSRSEHTRAGYDFVYTPHLAKAGLFETSGHLEWYAENMYPPMEMEGATYYPKPMNCPMHMLIYRSSQRSYRELPMRLFEFGTVYRFERSGVLHGLTRVRGLTQDDAHILCTPEQLAGELASLLAFVLRMLRTFGLTDFEAELATRPEKFVGEPEEWDAATEALRSALEEAGVPYVVAEGEGSFYAPKIDVHVRDAIGRRWQMSTLQVDFQLPSRFDLTYVGADNGRHRPYMIHRALFGSIERFFGILIEHYAGAFPTWLAPVQARVLAVRSDNEGYAATVLERLQAEGFRADTVEADEGLGARIRKAKLEKLPFIVVVGPDDEVAGTVGVNTRGDSAPERGVALEDFVARLAADATPAVP
ncbi:MAG: threonine--tRNA ligase [Actinomycetota bacterium]|nr:threonine--tRNA ligase [Actinomycetota bacterium]